jgi:hypothetical protein
MKELGAVELDPFIDIPGRTGETSKYFSQPGYFNPHIDLFLVYFKGWLFEDRAMKYISCSQIRNAAAIYGRIDMIIEAAWSEIK